MRYIHQKHAQRGKLTLYSKTKPDPLQSSLSLFSLPQATHTAKENEKFIRSCYEYFLTEVEIEDTLKGVEHYLSSDEIRERLQKREEIKAQQQSQAEQDMFDNIEKQALDNLSAALS